jgi:hypothetical protein
MEFVAQALAVSFRIPVDGHVAGSSCSKKPILFNLTTVANG